MLDPRHQGKDGSPERKEDPWWKHALYWLGATIGLVGIFVVFAFGAMSVALSGFGLHQALASLHILLGLIVLILSVKKPHLLVRSFILRAKGPYMDDQVVNKRIEAFKSFFAFMGTGLVLGGLIYGFTSELAILMVTWAVIALSTWIFGAPRTRS